VAVQLSSEAQGLGDLEGSQLAQLQGAEIGHGFLGMKGCHGYGRSIARG